MILTLLEPGNPPSFSGAPRSRSSAGGAAGAAWNSFWTGTRPIQWLYGNFSGSEQIFHFSRDMDGTNRLWEAFSPDRLDDGCPITWYAEMRAIDGGTPLQQKAFRYSDLYLQELSGKVDIGVFWSGAARGKYKKILAKRITASRGSIRTGSIITASTKLFALKNQSRVLRTEDARELASRETLSSTGIESPEAEFLDESFQLLVVGSGPAALQAIRYYLEPPAGQAGSNSPNKELSGGVESDEPEENFVRFDGAAAESHDFDEALAALSADIPLYVSNRTATVTQGGLTSVMTGYGESIISQDDADKIALAVATKKAVGELQRDLPKIVSVGLELA